MGRPSNVENMRDESDSDRIVTRGRKLPHQDRKDAKPILSQLWQEKREAIVSLLWEQFSIVSGMYGHTFDMQNVSEYAPLPSSYDLLLSACCCGVCV